MADRTILDRDRANLAFRLQNWGKVSKVGELERTGTGLALELYQDGD